MCAYLHSAFRCICMLPGIHCPCTMIATPHLWARNKVMAVFPFALFHDSFALFPLPLHLPSWNPPFPAKTQETAKLDPRRPSSSPESFYALAEAESFVVMLCKMPRRGWDMSLPAWPPCQLSCRRTPSLLATGELGSVMCSICWVKGPPSVCEHNNL